RLAIARAVTSGFPLVIFESPVRTGQTLRDLLDAAGDRPAMVARELTKLHEELRPGTLGELAAAYATSEPRGEIVIVVGGQETTAGPESDVPSLIRRLLEEGHKPSKVARDVSRIAGISGSSAYDMVREVAGRVDSEKRSES
ncbi:MAG TPA: hypothetical protein VGR08_04165, partial [Thermomicrobiales bacterium]|nr:hypothetical protein [Thermomicrobiales bacterium]